MIGKPKKIYLTRESRLKSVSLTVPASKSESNRALILDALAGGAGNIGNLSTARDTETMARLLKSTDHKLDVIDAGTTMRFLTAYLAMTRQDRLLTGTARMRERPIGILVNALREIGARIEYVNREGFPPIHIRGCQPVQKNRISIRGDVSSQFISAVLMIAPLLPNGLTLVLEGKPGSVPYIEMTLGLMKRFGVASEWTGNEIRIRRQSYRPAMYRVQPDWSGASYWFGFAALAEDADLLLKDYTEDSLQGDRVICRIMEPLGVESRFTAGGLHLSKKNHNAEFRFDFSNCPDLAQSVAVVCAAKGIAGIFTGLESLRIKETDRIAALRGELGKIGADFKEIAGNKWVLTPRDRPDLTDNLAIKTYEDHRMAMAFAPLATMTNLIIEDPDIVVKSYPSFWTDVEKAGVRIVYG